MTAILIDAVLLLVLLKLINNGDRDFVTALVTAFVVAIGTPILVFAMLFANGAPPDISDAQMMLTVIVSMAAVAGVALLVLGVEWPKSLLTTVLYATLHVAITFALGMMPAA